MKRNRHDAFSSIDVPFSSMSFERLSDDEDSETMSSPMDFESPQVTTVIIRYEEV